MSHISEVPLCPTLLAMSHCCGHVPHEVHPCPSLLAVPQPSREHHSLCCDLHVWQTSESQKAFTCLLSQHAFVCHLFVDLHRGLSSFYGLAQGFVIFLWTYTGVRHLFMNLHRGFSSFCGLTRGFDLHTGLSSFSGLTQGC